MSEAIRVPEGTIASAGREIRQRTTTSEQLTESCLERISQHPDLNAFITVLADAALNDARRLDEEMRAGHDRGPLHGIPLSLKDLVDLEGTLTTGASRVFEDRVAARHAPVVARLKNAGAVFVGKCNLHEFAYGTTSEDSAFGPVRHPLDKTRSPGGSSGGSAVAVATGMCLASIGTDTGGSIRIPASICGLVGLKPGYGELSCEGVVPLSRSLDHVGPIGRTVADAQILYQIMRGDAPNETTKPTYPLRCRLGVPRRYFLDLLDHDVRALFNESVARLRASGAIVQDVEITHASDAASVYLHIGVPEATQYHAPMLEQRPESYTRNVRLRLEAGRYLLAEDYVRAQRVREVLRSEVDVALAGYDGLILPTVPIQAPLIGTSEVDVNGSREPVRSVMLRLTQLFNLTGHPAISIPAGQTAQGLPCGTQLIGARGRTLALLELARRCEPCLAAP